MSTCFKSLQEKSSIYFELLRRMIYQFKCLHEICLPILYFINTLKYVSILLSQFYSWQVVLNHISNLNVVSYIRFVIWMSNSVISSSQFCYENFFVHIIMLTVFKKSSNVNVMILHLNLEFRVPSFKFNLKFFQNSLVYIPCFWSNQRLL